MFPTTGSTMSAATAPRWLPRSAATDSRLLNRAVSVSAATAEGTPGLSGTLSVIAPDPALMRNASA